MKFTINVSAPKRDPEWRVVFKRKWGYKPLVLRAKTEGYAVRELMRRSIDLKSVESLTQISVWIITFLCTLLLK